NNHTAALAGLVAVLGLTTHLYLDNDPTTLTTRLTTIANQHHQAVRDITAAVDASIGDLATATYR
ncbi:GPP34 family phosphoprotein, partial [Micromonospora carbonacea]